MSICFRDIQNNIPKTVSSAYNEGSSILYGKVKNCSI